MRSHPNATSVPHSFCELHEEMEEDLEIKTSNYIKLRLGSSSSTGLEMMGLKRGNEERTGEVEQPKLK